MYHLKIAQVPVSFHGVTVYVLPEVKFLTMQEDGYIQQWLSKPTFESKGSKVWINEYLSDGRVIAVADARLVKPENSLIEVLL